MKIENLSLVGFLLFVIIFNVSCGSTFKPKKVFQKFYYVQKLYPGQDFISSLKLESSMKLAYFTLNRNMLYFSESLEKKDHIQGISYLNLDSISLAKIVDPKNDNPKIGKCCFNILYHNFAKGINRKKTSKFKVKNTGIMNILDANYCIEVLVRKEAHWRICSNKAISINKLHMQIAYKIMKMSNKKKQKGLAGTFQFNLATFIKNFKLTEYDANVDFDWEGQLKWKGRCQTRFIQSPINAEKQNISPNLQKDFSISYVFYDVYPVIARRFNEAVIKFSNHPGIVRIGIDNNRILFKPKYISFRFPGEHAFGGKRPNGEMLIHLKELMPDKKRRSVSSLVITIPFENNRENPNLSVLESLNMDFWKEALKTKSEHQPKNFESNLRNVFSLPEIFNLITISQSKFFFYLGSETVPPCTEFAYHIIVEKPLKISNCQLKILRDNSLLVQGFRQIHSRLTQDLLSRNVYLIDKLISNPNLEADIPQEYLDLSEELYGESLLQEKLSTIDRLKALESLKKGLRSGKVTKYDKNGVKIVRNGVGIKDELYGDLDAYDSDNEDPEYQKKFGKKGKYGLYGKFGKLFGRTYGSGRGHSHQGRGIGYGPGFGYGSGAGRGDGSDGSSSGGDDIDGDLNC